VIRRRAGIGVVLFVVAACGPTTPAPSVEPIGSRPAVEQVLRLAYAEVPTLDPHLSTDKYVSLLVRGLTWFDEELRTVPGLAESWDVTDGGSRVTFHLREAAYSSGEPIVADDFVYGWRRALDPRIGGHYGFLLADVVGAPELLALDPAAPPADAEIDALLDGLGVSAPDPRTLEVTLIRPAVYFPTVVANPALAPIPEAWIAQPGATEAVAYWSSGPFVLSEWVHGQQRTLEPNPTWWGEPIGLEAIEMRTFPSEEAAVQAYADGAIDLVDLTGPATAEDLASTMIERPGAGFSYVPLNVGRPGSPLTDSLALREALGLAWNREEYAELHPASGPAASAPIPPGVPGHDPSLESVFDPEEGRRLLDRALDELGLGGPEELSLTFLHGTLAADWPRYLQGQWRDVLGIEVALTGLEPEPYLELIGSEAHRDFDMVWLAWIVDYPHPQSYLEPLWACSSVLNTFGYCNPDVDALLLEGAATTEEDEQLATYQEAQHALVSDAANIFLEWPVGWSLVAPRVDGLVVTTFDNYYGLLFPERLRIVAD
jgi:ABC-type oligopeptide transport system substrate-binding subunit